MSALNRREFFATAGKGAAALGLVAAAGVSLHADPLGIPLGSQTYPVRARIAAGEFGQVLKDMFAAGIRQIELCSPGYNELKSLADGKQTRKMIEDAGLKCPSSHFSFNEFRDTLPKAIEWAQAVGLTQMGTASLPANMGTPAAPIVIMNSASTSEESIKRAADAYGRSAPPRRRGFSSSCTTRRSRTRTNDGRLTYPILLTYLDPDLVKMQFQMSSMRTIGNPIAYFNLYPGRFISAHVHGVDLEGPAPVGRGPAMPIKPDPNAPGRGARGAGGAGAPGGAPAGPAAVAIGDDSVNWPAVFTAAKTGGMKNFFIEQEQANGGWEAMVKGAAYLKTVNVT